jgi:hypothetical protein
MISILTNCDSAASSGQFIAICKFGQARIDFSYLSPNGDRKFIYAFQCVSVSIAKVWQVLQYSWLNPVN